MFFSQLSTLKDLFPVNQLEKFDKYLSTLSPSALKMVTVEKVSLATEIDYDTSMRLLKACVDFEICNKRYALCCPECSGFLRVSDDINDLIKIDEVYCNRCEESFHFDETNLASNIEVIFSVERDENPFVVGQQLIEPFLVTEGQTVAPTRNLESAVQHKIVSLDDLFAPTENEFLELERQLCIVKQPHKTTTETGASLESFCATLFGLCKIFRTTTHFRSDTHQIDTFVRVSSYIPNGLFGISTNYYAIECKNENRTPKGEYLSKLHSALHTMGGKLGIIVSRKTAPSTYPKLAHDFFLKDDMCFIWFNLYELELLIKRRGNLLDAMECKIMELKTNSLKSFSELGLSDG